MAALLGDYPVLQANVEELLRQPNTQVGQKNTKTMIRAFERTRGCRRIPGNPS